ncbi:hypothetical protein CEXT_715821 [Caerostris extrusa]|uniref:Uncharacterized protein n=1 Tax=Caerostris extrusa TaxID=172846 RepID=A0AAV4WJS6_CAEEX|nr:hypothetical protein CEXT_715821 [Caerostris extrusa]
MSLLTEKILEANIKRERTAQSYLYRLVYADGGTPDAISRGLLIMWLSTEVTNCSSRGTLSSPIPVIIPVLKLILVLIFVTGDILKGPNSPKAGEKNVCFVFLHSSGIQNIGSMVSHPPQLETFFFTPLAIGFPTSCWERSGQKKRWENPVKDEKGWEQIGMRTSDIHL